MCCPYQPVCIGARKMIAKVVLGTMQNAKKLVNIVEHIPYDEELCNGRYVVNAKSMLGVLSMSDFEDGELHIHTDNETECEEILEKLLEQGLLADTNDPAFLGKAGKDMHRDSEKRTGYRYIGPQNIFHIGELSLTSQLARGTAFYGERGEEQGRIDVLQF